MLPSHYLYDSLKQSVLNKAITDQIEHFSHVMLEGLTHNPVLKLSKRLEKWLPGDLDYCFFSDSGSVAVEVILKMALQYNTNHKNNKNLELFH